MIVAEILAKSSPRKIINIYEQDNSLFNGTVKDCPVELYNLEVLAVSQWVIRVKSQTNVSLRNIQRDKIIEIIESLKRIVNFSQESSNEDETS